MDIDLDGKCVIHKNVWEVQVIAVDKNRGILSSDRRMQV